MVASLTLVVGDGTLGLGASGQACCGVNGVEASSLLLSECGIGQHRTRQAVVR